MNAGLVLDAVIPVELAGKDIFVVSHNLSKAQETACAGVVCCMNAGLVLDAVIPVELAGKDIFVVSHNLSKAQETACAGVVCCMYVWSYIRERVWINRVYPACGQLS